MKGNRPGFWLMILIAIPFVILDQIYLTLLWIWRQIFGG